MKTVYLLYLTFKQAYKNMLGVGMCSLVQTIPLYFIALTLTALFFCIQLDHLTWKNMVLWGLGPTLFLWGIVLPLLFLIFSQGYEK